MCHVAQVDVALRLTGVSPGTRARVKTAVASLARQDSAADICSRLRCAALRCARSQRLLWLVKAALGNRCKVRQASARRVFRLKWKRRMSKRVLTCTPALRHASHERSLCLAYLLCVSKPRRVARCKQAARFASVCRAPRCLLSFGKLVWWHSVRLLETRKHVSLKQKQTFQRSDASHGQRRNTMFVCVCETFERCSLIACRR